MPQSDTGHVQWIGLRPEKRGSINSVSEVAIAMESGLEGDHFHANGPERRQVTLIQQEHLPVIAMLLGIDEIRPEMTRRNILVSGINLLSLEDQKFQIGDVILQCTGPCEPCKLMETTIGPGALTAMTGHGGIMAKVIQPGTIRVNDEVRRFND